MKKILPLFLLLVALPVSAADTGDVPASGPAAMEQCLSPDRHSRDRPAGDCEPVLSVFGADEAREYRLHILREAQFLEFQVLGYGLLIGFAGRLAGRSFWRWFGLGVLMRVGLAALALLPM